MDLARNFLKRRRARNAHELQDRARAWSRARIVLSDANPRAPHSEAEAAELKTLAVLGQVGLTPADKEKLDIYDHEQLRRLITKAEIVGLPRAITEPLHIEQINTRFLERLNLATGKQLDDLKSWDDVAAMAEAMAGEGGGPRKRSTRKRKSRKRSARKRKSRKRSARKRKSRKRSARKR